MALALLVLPVAATACGAGPPAPPPETAPAEAPRELPPSAPTPHPAPERGQAPGDGAEASPPPPAQAPEAPALVRPSVTQVGAPAREIARGPQGGQDRRQVALTFDCGASSRPTPAILAALAEAGVAATFFVTGQWAQGNPELLREIASRHELGNHSYSHPDLTKLSDAEIARELARMEAAAVAITGRSTKPYFRAPFGARDPRVLGVAAQEGYPLHVYWTLDSADWRTPQEMPPAAVLSRVLRNVGSGAIVIQHCGSPQTAQVLPQLLQGLGAQGFELVTLSRLLRP